MMVKYYDYLCFSVCAGTPLFNPMYVITLGMTSVIPDSVITTVTVTIIDQSTEMESRSEHRNGL